MVIDVIVGSHFLGCMSMKVEYLLPFQNIKKNLFTCHFKRSSIFILGVGRINVFSYFTYKSVTSDRQWPGVEAVLSHG